MKKLSPEEELDLFINSLNKEQKPQHVTNNETLKLLAVAGAVKSLGHQAEPSGDFGKRLSKSILKISHPRFTRSWLSLPAAAMIAGLFIFGLFTIWNSQKDVVYAMEEAAAKVKNYYGVMEVHGANQAGEDWLVRKVEIWSQGDKYATRQNDGVLTVNNGERKWQIRPEAKEAALLPVIPDNVGQGFDLRDEVKRAVRYPHTVVGQGNLNGRQVTKIKIAPPGGKPYFLWIDKETDLPLQLQTSMQNALQTTYTFVTFEPNTAMKPGLFAFQLPIGYKLLEEDPGQQVAAINEAVMISRFTPLMPKDTPARIFAFQHRIVLDYGATTIEQKPATEPFKPENYGALGKIAGGPLEVIDDSLRWQQKGIELKITGPDRLALARQISSDITLPETGKQAASKAKVEVPVDMEIAKADQQQVDAGHSPWQLDPVFVASVFANLKVTPAGIRGEPQIPESAFKLEANNGVEAVVDVTEGPVKKVFLKRLIRQDATGIWSVIGYDPR